MALESQNAAVIWGTPAEQSGDDWSASVPLAFSKVWKPNPASEDACAPVGGGTLNLQSSFVGRIGRWWWAPQWKAKASDHAPEARPCPRTGRARGSQVIGFYYSFNRLQRLLNWRRKGWIDQQFHSACRDAELAPLPFLNVVVRMQHASQNSRPVRFNVVRDSEPRTRLVHKLPHKLFQSQFRLISRSGIACTVTRFGSTLTSLMRPQTKIFPCKHVSYLQ